MRTGIGKIAKAAMTRKKKLTEDEKLLRLYGILVQLVTYEGQLAVNRTNIFLLASSILLTGFMLGETFREIGLFYLGIPSVGIILCFLHAVMGWRTINAANFWRNSIALIERGSLFKDLEELDLTIFTTHHRYHKGETIKQFITQEIAGKLPGIGPLKKLACFRILDPNSIQFFWIPFLFLSVWISCLYYFAIYKFDWLFGLIISLILLALIGIGNPYLVSLEIFEKVWKKIKLKIRRSRKLFKSLNLKNIDGMIILGSQVYLDIMQGEVVPAPHTELKARAAGIAWKIGLPFSRCLIISGGHGIWVRYLPCPYPESLNHENLPVLRKSAATLLLSPPDFSEEAKGKARKYPSEAQVIKGFIMKHYGVPEGLFRLEEDSTTTEENAKFCKPIIGKEGLKKVALLTILPQMPRALEIFKKNGIEAHPIFAEDLVIMDDPSQVTNLITLIKSLHYYQDWDMVQIERNLREGKSIRKGLF